LYEQAIADEDRRLESLTRANQQSEKAINLKGNEFTVSADFGEIARPTDPELSLDFHYCPVVDVTDFGNALIASN
jgi:hypothetical protein